jgi:MFS transporter, OFA family, oxalate/formate antiporter
LTQAMVFFLLSRVHGFVGLAVLAFIVLLCYGGGFGTMPAFAADFFGSRNVGSIYGLMLTAWGFAGLFGPKLIAHVRQSTGHYAGALEMIAAIMLVSSVLPFVIQSPKDRNKPLPGTALNQSNKVLTPTR